MITTILKKALFSFGFNTATFLCLLSLLVSCKKKTAEVSISNEVMSTSRVVLDDTLQLKVLPESEKYSTFLMSVGPHSFTMNGGEKKNFNVPEEGGILNLGRQEFVIFPVTYTNTASEDVNHYIVEANYPILLGDSLVVYNKDVANSQAELIQVLQNKEVRDFLNRDLIKIPADQLFISKSWDFDLDQNPTDSISVEINSKGTKPHGFRSKITDTKTFLFYAKLLDEYKIEAVENKRELEELLTNSIED